MILNCLPQSTSQPLKTLDLSVQFKRGVEVEKTLDDLKKGICDVKTMPDLPSFLLCTMVSEAISIIMISWIPDFLSFHFTVESPKKWGWVLLFVPGT